MRAYDAQCTMHKCLTHFCAIVQIYLILLYLVYYIFQRL